MNAMLLPESWVVQPTVVSMHAAKDPERKRRFSIVAERAAKSVRPIQVVRHVEASRLKTLGFAPCDAVGLEILRWIMHAGDPRYWSWKATKPEHHGNVRNSLSYELGKNKSHVKKSVKRLTDDGLVEVSVAGDRKEIIQITHLGKVLLAEADWRSRLRDWAPDARDHFEAVGYQEASIVVDRALLINELEHTEKRDVVWAALEGYEEGERYA